MRTAVLVLFALGLILLLLGHRIERQARSADEGIAAVIPYLVGIALWAIDLILVVGWALVRLFG